MNIQREYWLEFIKEHHQKDHGLFDGCVWWTLLFIMIMTFVGVLIGLMFS